MIAYSDITRAAILSKSEKKKDKKWVAAQKQNQLDPLLQDFLPALAGDGDPTITLNTLQRENILYRKQIFGLGGFHVTLTAWRSMGRCYGPGVTRSFFSLWRKSNKALDWVEDPGMYYSKVYNSTTVSNLIQLLYVLYCMLHIVY